MQYQDFSGGAWAGMEFQRPNRKEQRFQGQGPSHVKPGSRPGSSETAELRILWQLAQEIPTEAGSAESIS